MKFRSEIPPSFERPSVGEILGGIGLVIGQMVTAALCYGVLILTSFSADGCSENDKCDYGMAGVSLTLMPITLALVVPLSIIFAVLLTRRGHPVLLSPVVGNIVVFLAAVIAVTLNVKAFN